MPNNEVSNIEVTNINPIYSDPAVLKDKCILAHDKSTGDPIRFDASKLATTAKDLSMFTTEGASLGSRETANCYVVRTPGVYKFPVVYGNAIKHGVANTAAHTTDNTSVITVAFTFVLTIVNTML